MKRLLNHFYQILVMGAVLFLMLKIHLYKIPYIQTIMNVLIFILIGLWTYLLFSKRKHTTGHKKKKILLLVLGILLFCEPLQAGQYCSLAESYHHQTFDAKQKNWKGDKPCDEKQRDDVRQQLNKLSKSPSVFIATDKLTAQEQKTWRSFRKDSNWSAWVGQNFAGQGLDAEEMACAAVYSSLCSEYERRHPDTRAKTVTQIMKKEAETTSCWPCKMAYITLRVVQRMSIDLEKNMCEAGLNILKIFMLLWILYTVFLAVIFPSKGKTFLKDLLTRMLSVMICAMILSSGENLKTLYSSVLSPIVGLGLGLTEEISDSIKDSTFVFSEDVRSKTLAGVNETDYCSVSQEESAGTDNNASAQKMKNALPNLNISDSLITPELEVSLLCMTQKMYRQVSPMTAIGQSLIGFSFADGDSEEGVSFPDLSLWSVGIVLVGLFSVFGFLVAFKIIDIFLRLGFVLVLMPLFVATWAFPLTRDFTNKGFKFLMGIITEFLALALAINFIMLIFEVGISMNKDELVAAMVAPYSSTYGENLYNVILSKGGWFFFFMLIALFKFGLKLFSTCTKLVGTVFGTKSSMGLGGDITGAIAAAAISKTATNVWKPASSAAKKIKPYQVKDGKSAGYLAGRAAGRMKAGENPLKDLGETGSPAASKRYFGQKTGNGVDRASQYLAAGIDKIGIGLGQGLNKTGIGAIVGVPLTLGTKSLSLGVRAAGKVGAGLVKAPGAITQGIKNAPKTFKKIGTSIKNAPKAAWNGVKSGSERAWNGIKGAPKALGNALMAGPRKVIGAFKKGFSDGKK